MMLAILTNDRPVDGVDIPLAKNVLEYNMKRFAPFSMSSTVLIRLSDIQTVFSSFTSRLDCTPRNANPNWPIVR